MKVVIINSPLFKDRNPLYDEDSLPPIGLGYIATYLQNKGIEVELIDAVYSKIPLQELIDSITKSKPDFIAANIFTTNYHLVKEFFESLKFKSHFIIGGLSTKGLHKEIIGWKVSNPLDVVIGDGELISLAIVNGDVQEDPIFSHANFNVYKVDSRSAYYLNDISDQKLDRGFFLNEPILHPFGFTEANIVASRGCIYNCTFCAAARSLNSEFTIRERTEQSLITELQQIQVEFPKVNSIRVLDDLFLKNSLTIKKATNVFSNFNFGWRSMAHVLTFQNVDLNSLQAMKESGCQELFIGVESGSPRILRAINKTHKVETIYENLTKVFKAKINIKGYFIYGFPDETLEDMEMTFQLAERLKFVAQEEGVYFRTSVFQYRPYHATEIFHDLVDKGVQTQVKQLTENKKLSELVGRIQFNFHSGNYSTVDLDRVHEYIYRTTNLNDTGLFQKIGLINQPANE